MSNSRRISLLAASMLVGLTGCDTTGPRQTAAAEPAAHREQPRNESKSKKMKITIGKKTFTATLDDNPAAARLRAMLPLTLDMSELNGNEKYSRLPTPLPTDATDPGTIRNGDLMLWGADTLVLFYKSFPTLQLHPARADRRPGGPGRRGRFGERDGDLRAGVTSEIDKGDAVEIARRASRACDANRRNGR